MQCSPLFTPTYFPCLAHSNPSLFLQRRYWSIDSEFRDLTLWHHDFPPPLDHCLHQVEEWCTLAKAVRFFVD